MLTPVMLLWAYVQDQARRLRDDEGGYTTETVLITAILVGIALAVAVLLKTLVIDKVSSIHL